MMERVRQNAREGGEGGDRDTERDRQSGERLGGKRYEET